MATEITIPLLPCKSIDEIADFYQMLGFERTHRQTRPNPYVVVQLEDIELHFFGIPEFNPEQSYGNCVIQVPDTSVLYDTFARGMRSRHGKLLASGIPRMTRPRKRKNTGNVSGFTVIDPGGNWIRIFQQPETQQPGHIEDPARSKLATALENAIVQGDSRGNAAQAAKILDGKLTKELELAPISDQIEALVYRAELAVTLHDRERAGTLLAQVRAIETDAIDQDRIGDTLSHAAELERIIANPTNP